MADDAQVPTNTSPPLPYAQPEDPNSSPLGVYASFDYSSEPFAELSDKAKNALMGLDLITTKTDAAARRFEVEQALKIPAPSIT